MCLIMRYLKRLQCECYWGIVLIFGKQKNFDAIIKYFLGGGQIIWCPEEDSNLHTTWIQASKTCASTSSAIRARKNIIMSHLRICQENYL